MQGDLAALRVVETELLGVVEEVIAVLDGRSNWTLASEQILQMKEKLVLARTRITGDLHDLIARLVEKYDNAIDPLVWVIRESNSHEVRGIIRYSDSYSRTDVLRDWLRANQAEPGDIYISLELEQEPQIVEKKYEK